MEENDDLPVYLDHTLRSLFYHPPFWDAILTHIVSVRQEFPEKRLKVRQPAADNTNENR
jgi:hypothetical protein